MWSSALHWALHESITQMHHMGASCAPLSPIPPFTQCLVTAWGEPRAQLWCIESFLALCHPTTMDCVALLCGLEHASVPCSTMLLNFNRSLCASKLNYAKHTIGHWPALSSTAHPA